MTTPSPESPTSPRRRLTIGRLMVAIVVVAAALFAFRLWAEARERRRAATETMIRMLMRQAEASTRESLRIEAAIREMERQDGERIRERERQQKKEEARVVLRALEQLRREIEESRQTPDCP